MLKNGLHVGAAAKECAAYICAQKRLANPRVFSKFKKQNQSNLRKTVQTNIKVKKQHEFLENF